MALALALSVTQSGDAKTITVTDDTGDYSVSNTGGWGAPNPVLATDIIDGALTLTITITTSDDTVTAYTAIDLHPLLTAHLVVTDLVYELDCSMLISGGTALGTSDDAFPDGLYAMTYSWTGAGPVNTHATVLIDGVVKAALYEALRTIPTKYECQDYHERDVLDIIFQKGYYDAMIATAIVGREDQVIDQLLVLERLLLNGSNYTW
jgi:hypothetical protein